MNAQELAIRYQAGERDFKRADLHGAVLKGFQLKEADLRSANLQDADLSRANLQKANFNRAFLDNANIADADLEQADLRESSLNNTDLSRAILSRAILSGSSICGARMTYAELNHAYIDGANLTNADLEKADLRGARLGKADFTNANLSFAVIDKETDFTSTILTGAEVQGVNLFHLSQTAILPDGTKMNKKSNLKQFFGMPSDLDPETHPLMRKNMTNHFRYKVSFPTRDMQQALGDSACQSAAPAAGEPLTAISASRAVEKSSRASGEEQVFSAYAREFPIAQTASSIKRSLNHQRFQGSALAGF